MNSSRLLRSPHGGGNDGREAICKVVILGLPGVGKTALTVRFLTKRFIGEYCPTLESVYRYISTPHDDEDIRLDILDTAGQTANEWKDSYGLWGDCFIFVYSITEYASFEELSRLRRLVENSRRSSAIICAVVGSKNDLVYERQVTVSQGRGLAADMGACFYELSACDWSQLPQVCSLFSDLYTAWRRSRGIRESRQRKPSSSAKFKQAIQKVISGKSSTVKRNSSMTSFTS